VSSEGGGLVVKEIGADSVGLLENLHTAKTNNAYI
jgi:hypothetical protein